MKRIAVLLLVLLAVGLTVSSSADHPCSVADLNGDCNVDLRDYSIFQTAFSGAEVFELVGPTWDVFKLNTQFDFWEYEDTFVFFHNGTVQVNSTNRFTFYEFDGETITIQHIIRGEACDGSERDSYTELSFLSANELTGGSFCPNRISSLRALRRF